MNSVLAHSSDQMLAFSNLCHLLHYDQGNKSLNFGEEI